MKGLLPEMRQHLYACIMIFISSSNLTTNTTYMIGIASCFAGPLQHQINNKRNENNQDEKRH